MEIKQERCVVCGAGSTQRSQASGYPLCQRHVRTCPYCYGQFAPEEFANHRAGCNATPLPEIA